MTPDYSLARSFDGDACYRWLSNERNIRWLKQYGNAETENGTAKDWSYELLEAARG